MKTLFKNAKIIDVVNEKIVNGSFAVENDRFVSVGGEYDCEIDLKGQYVCPGFIDGHIHIESTMLLPHELAKISLTHGTTGIVADPHEIANVCGKDGIRFMMSASKGLPFDVYFMLPSCVPATRFDESYTALSAEDLDEFYNYPEVLGLAEMMNYVGVVNGDEDVVKKINGAISKGKVVNGHAPLLSGEPLKKYISYGISDDHECSNFEEAKEKFNNGMAIMIRQGTSAKNLRALIPLFSLPYSEKCMLVTDDKHPADLLNNGHIDSIIRESITLGVNPITAIKMATLNVAKHFNLNDVGVIKSGFKADFAVLNDLQMVTVRDVYKGGKAVVVDGKIQAFNAPEIPCELFNAVKSTVNVTPMKAEDFMVEPIGKKARVIRVIKGELLTEQTTQELDFTTANGIDVKRDLLKLAVVERHRGTGHKAIGYVTGIGLQRGAIASTVSHDSHNLIVIGANETDMAIACNELIKSGGGSIVVDNGKVLSLMRLPIAGLMSEASAKDVANENEHLRKSVYDLGVSKDIEPFMMTAFISLAVIPHIKMTTMGLVDVEKQMLVSLFE